MTEEVTLGYTLENGTEINMHVGVRDWNAQCALVEDTLHTYHIQSGNTDADMPAESILNAAYCVRNMRDELVKYDVKLDELIAENMELAEKLDTAVNGVKTVTAINKELGEQNELMRKVLAENGLLTAKEETLGN